MAYNVGMSGPGARDDTPGGTADDRRLRLETMFRQYAPRVLDYARHRGATLAEAEDVVSEVFIVLTRRLDEVRDEVLPWLCGVARKVLGNQMRGTRRRLALTRRIEEEGDWLDPDGSDVPAAGSADILITRALSMLSARDREVLLLVAWDELSYKEAALSLGCTSAAFAQMLHRARRRVSEIIEKLRADEAAKLALGDLR